jgi:hypothetical protein
MDHLPEAAVLGENGNPKKPYSPPQLCRLTAADVVRKAIEITRVQDLERARHARARASAIEDLRALQPRSRG